VLRASHRVLKPGGTTVFAVIAVGDDLNADQRDEAIAAGPPHVASDQAYPDLMRAVGFEHVETADVTTEYLETLTAWWREWETESVDLRRVVGDDEYTERQANRMRAIRAVQDGLLRRYLITGVRA
jgi:hypothetical protein